jgi:hypothetical protein
MFGITDHEFDAATRQMVFVDAEQRLKVTKLDSKGLPVSPGCAGTLIDPDAAYLMPYKSPLFSGPEWAHSQRGTEVFYMHRNASGQPELARAWKSGSQCRWETLPNGVGRGSVLGSQDAPDPQPRLLYAWTADNGSNRLAWRESTMPETEQSFFGLTPSRWVPAQRAVTTSIPGQNGVQQAARYVIDSRSHQVLTSGPGRNNEVHMWSAPEFGGDLVFVTVINECCIRAFRQSGVGWSLYFIQSASTRARSWPTSPRSTLRNRWCTTVIPT